MLIIYPHNDTAAQQIFAFLRGYLLAQNNVYDSSGLTVICINKLEPAEIRVEFIENELLAADSLLSALRDLTNNHFSFTFA